MIVGAQHVEPESPGLDMSSPYVGLYCREQSRLFLTHRIGLQNKHKIYNEHKTNIFQHRPSHRVTSL